MSTVSLKTVVWQEGEHFVSWCLNTGVSSFGDTKAEAIESLNEALQLYFEDVSPGDVQAVESLDIVPMSFNYA